MKRVLAPFLTADIGKDYYRARKGEYTVLFLLLLMIYIIPMGILEFFRVKSSWTPLVITAAVSLFFIFLLYLIKRDKLEWAGSLLIAVGLLKTTELLLWGEPGQFYVQAYLVLFATAAVHLYKVQFYVSVAGTVVQIVIRNLIEAGVIPFGSPAEPLSSPVSINIVYGNILLVSVVFFVVKIMDREIINSSELENAANTDALTGIYNRRKLDASTIPENRLERTVFMMADIDHFKAINDRYGHDTGDEVLKQFASLVRTNLRSQDRFYRWGGEEFLLILRETDRQEGFLIAERIRESIAKALFPKGIKLTVSIGLTCGHPAEELRQTIHRADACLYEAKEGGRNQTRRG